MNGEPMPTAADTEKDPTLLDMLDDQYFGTCNFILTARQTLWHAIPKARDTLAPWIDYVHRELAQLGDGFEYSAEQVEISTRMHQVNAEIVADCAAIVLAHAAVDAHVLECIRAIASVAPEKWGARLEKKKVDLSAVLAKGVEAVRRAEILDDLDDLGRKSLPVKMDVLYAICGPPDGSSNVKEYTYDRSRLLTIDQLRHDIVHGGRFKSPIDTAEDDVTYLVKTGKHAIGTIRRAYGELFETSDAEWLIRSEESPAVVDVKS